MLLVSSLVTSQAWAQDSLRGTWTSHRADDGFWIGLTVDDRGWHQSRVLHLPDLPTGAVILRLDREPGVIDLEGTRRGDRAAGFFTFAPKPEFNEAVGRLGYAPFDFDELYLLTALDARIAEIRRLTDLGYDALSSDDLMSMHIHGALSDHVEAMEALGFGRLPVDDLIATRIHGVTPAFVRSMQEVGIEASSIDELVSMRIHDVTPDYIESIRSLGYPDVTIDELISMRIHDITPEYVRAVNEKVK
jgi:hypothetical protein